MERPRGFDAKPRGLEGTLPFGEDGEHVPGEIFGTR
jgi:hypothetical protein